MHDSFKTLVLGIGNPLRGDDGVGCAIVERLAALGRQDITSRSLHQLLPELADEIQSYARVVFVDACLDLNAGRWELSPVGFNAGDREVSHAINPSWLLGASRSLHGSIPPGWCLRVGGDRFEFEEGLSAEVSSVIDECVRCILRLVDSRKSKHA